MFRFLTCSTSPKVAASASKASDPIAPKVISKESVTSLATAATAFEEAATAFEESVASITAAAIAPNVSAAPAASKLSESVPIGVIVKENATKISKEVMSGLKRAGSQLEKIVSDNPMISLSSAGVLGILIGAKLFGASKKKQDEKFQQSEM